METLITLGQQIDRLALEAFNNMGSIPGVAFLSSALSAVGAGHLWVAIALGFLAADRRRDRWMMAIGVVIALLLTGYLTDFLKDFTARPRPYQVLGNVMTYGNLENSFAFPSGHASRAFAAATVLSVWFRSRQVMWFGLAVSIALTRLVLGLHYPSDVLAGAILGMAVGGLVSAALRLASKKGN